MVLHPSVCSMSRAGALTMIQTKTAVFIVFLGISIVALPANTTLMPIEEIRPGMIGIGRTVFQGTEQQEFKAHILGILRNTIGPRRNMILAKLQGGPLENTGVIAGMSGSPIYIDGRLIGAVAYSLGAFSKEPIAGITPIGEMIQSSTLPSSRSTSQTPLLELPVTQAGLTQALQDLSRRTRPFADRLNDLHVSGITTTEGQQLGTMLRPIATPLAIGGFSSDLANLVAAAFGEHGFSPVVTSLSPQTQPASTNVLKAGDAVGVSLIRGDMELAATGTVTYIDGNRVYAFGHPFYNLGPTEFPMTKAHVFTVLPSFSSSVKISSAGESIGTFQQDRATAIAGTLGQSPSLIPIHLSLNSAQGNRQFKFEIVNDQLFTPLLTYLSILNTLRAYERELGTATFTIKGTVQVKNYENIEFENVFTGDSASVETATYIAAPVAFLVKNKFSPVQLEKITLKVISTEQLKKATLERAWLNDIRFRPGQTVELKILIRTYRGESIIRTLPIDIPWNASGAISILVSDGANLTRLERHQMRGSAEPKSLIQTIRALQNIRRNDILYVRLFDSSNSAVVDGETLPSLPPSILAVFETDQTSGGGVSLQQSAIRDWELQTDHAVTGSRLLSINLDQR